MLDERELRWLQVALVFVIIGQVAIMSVVGLNPGNLAAAIICAGAVWIVRNRDRFRGE